MNDEYDASWFPGLVSLPDIARIEICGLGIYDTELPSAMSSLKSLTIGCSTREGFGYIGSLALSIVLERLLVKCPNLQYLDLTFQEEPFKGDDHWDSLGDMLSYHGPPLRTLRLFSPGWVVRPSRSGAPINLASMVSLRFLTLPIEAVLPQSLASLLHRQADGSDPDNNNSRSNDNVRNDAMPAGLQARDRGFDTATVSLTDMLPPSLTQLDIVDDMNIADNILWLDWELRKTMLSPCFGHLQTIELWRVQGPTDQMMNIGWDVQQQEGCWKVFRRV